MNQEMQDQRQRQVRNQRRNGVTAAIAVGVVAGMIGLSYASVPLYRLFCQVTGFGGTTQVAERAPAEAGERDITIRFNADTGGGMAWRFRPEQREITLKVGEQGLAFYRAENPTGHRIVGTATFNVTPLKAGPYFSKVECFCFTEQALEAGGSAELPVSFFVDPSINDDPNMRDVTTITLSYTFFEVEQNAERPAVDKDGGAG